MKDLSIKNKLIKYHKKNNKSFNLSVLIPNYNSSETIVRVFNSILKSLSNSEIIIADDDSKDNSINILTKLIEKNENLISKKNLEFKVFKAKKHLGVGATRNKCINESSSKFLLFMDSDLIINKKAVREMLKKIKDYDIVFPKIIFPNNKIMYPVFEYEKNYPLVSTCFLIKKNSLKKLKYFFDENYKSGIEDVDFFIRCNYYGLKAKYLANVNVTHLFKERTNCEERFYYEIRGIVYAMRKLRKILRKTNLKHCIKTSTLIKHFICALFNFNWSDWASYDRKNNLFTKFLLLFKKHPKISNKGSFYLVGLYFKAIFEGLILKVKD